MFGSSILMVMRQCTRKVHMMCDVSSTRCALVFANRSNALSPFGGNKRPCNFKCICISVSVTFCVRLHVGRWRFVMPALFDVFAHAWNFATTSPTGFTMLCISMERGLSQYSMGHASPATCCFFDGRFELIYFVSCLCYLVVCLHVCPGRSLATGTRSRVRV